MIKDYPDRFPSTNGATNPSSPNPAVYLSPPGTPTASTTSLSFTETPPPTPPPRSGPVLPPPRHPSTIPQTTYTPYIPRSRRQPLASPTPGNTTPLSPTGQQIPVIASSAQGGVTARIPAPSPSSASFSGSHGPHNHGPSAALLDKVRALDALPRLGALRTLDLKGNDIRVSLS